MAKENVNMEININQVDSQVLGILVLVPITSIDSERIKKTSLACSNCHKRSYSKFCPECGGKIIETECEGSYIEVKPLPDVRQEMEELGIVNHLPFSEEIEEGDYWRFLVKEYETIGHRSFFEPFHKEYDINLIKSDLDEAKEKFKTILDKYNGEVIFGLAGECVDW